MSNHKQLNVEILYLCTMYVQILYESLYIDIESNYSIIWNVFLYVYQSINMVYKDNYLISIKQNFNAL